MDTILPDFFEHIKKDSDMPELSSTAQQELWNRIESKNRHYDRRFVRLIVWSGSIAASICLLLVIGRYLLSPPPPKPAIVDYNRVMQSFESVDNHSESVHLVLSNNQKIPIEGQETQIDYDEEGRVNINKNEKLDVKKDTEDEKVVFNQLVVPAGKRSMITFNEGTVVWINSGSKLVYPVTFEKHKREIFIEGEIYMDVSHDPKRPFIVHTSSLDVKVLGTQFNVSAYTDHTDFQVALVSGEVEISSKDNIKEILRPNQLFSYNEERNDFSVSTVDASDIIAWKDGYYPFNSQDLGTVLLKLSKYYNVQFKWNAKLKGLICSGKLDLKDDLHEVLNTLEKSAPIEIRKTSEREYFIVVKP